MTKRGYTITEFVEVFPIGRSKLFELLAEGVIVARKNGRHLIIEHDEGERWLRSLPEHEPSKPRPGRRVAA